jgi:hypothetical protein
MGDTHLSGLVGCNSRKRLSNQKSSKGVIPWIGKTGVMNFKSLIMA